MGTEEVPLVSSSKNVTPSAFPIKGSKSSRVKTPGCKTHSDPVNSCKSCWKSAHDGIRWRISRCTSQPMQSVQRSRDSSFFSAWIAKAAEFVLIPSSSTAVIHALPHNLTKNSWLYSIGTSSLDALVCVLPTVFFNLANTRNTYSFMYSRYLLALTARCMLFCLHC